MHEQKISWPPSTQLAPVPAVLIGCGNAKGYPANLITVAWCGIINSDPPMLSVSIRKERYSHTIISETGEFSCNVPTPALARAVDYCGVVSGRKIDKFKACDLTALDGEKISAPTVAECPLTLECRVTEIKELGSHDLFLAEIVNIRVSSEFIDSKGHFDFASDGLLAYCHGAYYNLGEKLGTFGFSVKK